MNEWDELKHKAIGAILHDEFKDGVRFIVMRGPASLCAYLGVPSDHPLAGHNYDDLLVDCHGGLTFAGSGENWPTGWYWYGWDYAHAGDYCFYYDEPPLAGNFDHSKEHKWLLAEVIQDSWSAIYDFKKLVRLAEVIRNRCQQHSPMNIK